MSQQYQSPNDLFSSLRPEPEKGFLAGTITSLKFNSSLTYLKIYLRQDTREEDEGVEEGSVERPRSIPRTSSMTPRVRADEKEEEDDDDQTDDRGYLVNLIGPWSRYISEDLKTTLSLKIYLDAYAPEFDPELRSWDFFNGVRADLIVHDPTLNHHDGPKPFTVFSKRVDLGPLTAGLIGTSPPVKREPKEEVRIELSFSNHHLNQSIEPDPRSFSSSSKKRLTDSSSPSVKPQRDGGDLEEEGSEYEQVSHHLTARTRTRTRTDVNSKIIKRLTNLNPNKRICTQLQHSDRDDPIDLGLPSHPSNKSVTRSISNVAPSGNQNLPLNNPEEFKDWLSLDEIDKMTTGGPSRKFNLMAIIDHTKSERCEKASSGTCDYRMTVYLSDHSRPKGAKRVTCNLFWRTEEECPSWLKANWKMIFLFNVHKRSSTIYHTQIIGPARSYQWALWCPAYLGSREQLETSTQMGSRSNDPTLTIGDFRLTSQSLKRIAQDFYDSHLAYEDRSDLDRSHSFDPLSIPTMTSVFKHISDLTSPSPIKVDLCVKIVDIWRDAPGNDRLTVTDFTSNELLRFPIPMGLEHEPGGSMVEDQDVSPSLRFHLDHGGDRRNWRSTQSRLISIYVAQPILEVVLRKLDRVERIEASGSGRSGERWERVEGSNRRSRSSFAPNAHHFRAKFIDRFVRLNGIEIRFKSTTTTTATSSSSTAGIGLGGTVYGLMENPIIDHYQGGVGGIGVLEDDSLAYTEQQDLDRLDDLTLESFSSRILPIDPTDPILKTLDRARQAFQLELAGGSFT